jgi:hypothetical protein
MRSQLKTFSELSKLGTLKERFDYLKLDGLPTNPTFGGRRILNQDFYSSLTWQRARREVILRDQGCEMGLVPYEIPGIVYVHHINPITIEDVMNHSSLLFDPENLVCVSYDVHEALHYSNSDVLKMYTVVTRTKNDTCPWK